MTKLTYGLGVFAIGISSTTIFSGCASTPDAGPSGGAATTGGGGATSAGTGGVGTGGGGATGIQLTPPNSYVVLTGADAAPGAMAAPAAWGVSGAGCATCHQANGEGFAGLAPEVRHVPAMYAKWVVRNGRSFNGMLTGMTPFPTTTTDPVKMPAISDVDLDAVVAWLEAMPKPTTGEGLYKDFCGNCHGPKMGTGGIVPVAIAGKKMMDISQKVRVGEGADPALRNGFMPPEDASKLTDGEITLIMQFLGAVP